MAYFADFHIHSRFARATSPNLTLPVLDEFARKKGIAVLGTGDFTHPMWFDEIKYHLKPAPEDGLFILKTPASDGPTRFILSVEISSIYQQGGKNRRVHTVVMLPMLDDVANFNRTLESRGAKLSSDGRPIVGMSVKQITKLALEASPQAIVIPAHAWTPWFGVLGSMSGFDSLEECLEELAPEILAIETGLSSDPPMNWRLSALDSVALISSSDAHSPSKIGRESTKFEGKISYAGIRQALKTGAPSKTAGQKSSPTELVGTVEFFPEEGKYHFDGHSAHQIRLSPAETKANGGICPTCGRAVTVGVLSRVEALADRAENFKPTNAPQFKSLVPLEEIIAEVLEIGVGTKKVASIYDMLIAKFGNEMSVLLDAPLDRIESTATATIAEAIKRVRAGKLQIEPGYDGQYGKVHVFSPEDRSGFESVEQPSLF